MEDSRICRVLVVEDDDDQRALIRMLLEDEGYHVRVAATGHQGLTTLSNWQPTLILLDLHLPDMDGRRFRLEQRRLGLGLDVPLVLASAIFAEQIGAQMIELGAVGGIEKPFDVEVLMATIRRHCGANSRESGVPSGPVV